MHHLPTLSSTKVVMSKQGNKKQQNLLIAVGFEPGTAKSTTYQPWIPDKLDNETSEWVCVGPEQPTAKYPSSPPGKLETETSECNLNNRMVVLPLNQAQPTTTILSNPNTKNKLWHNAKLAPGNH